MTKAPKAPKLDGATKKLGGGPVKSLPDVKPKDCGVEKKKTTNP